MWGQMGIFDKIIGWLFDLAVLCVPIYFAMRWALQKLGIPLHVPESDRRLVLGTGKKILIYNIFELVRNMSAVGFLYLITITVLALAEQYWDYIVPLMSKNSLIVLCILAGVILFSIRTNYPFAYGVGELVIGIASIYHILSTPEGGSTSTEGSSLAKIVAIFAGIYIIVRGLDNMDKSVPTTLAERWDILLRWGKPRK
jgi:hypothetical protein